MGCMTVREDNILWRFFSNPLVGLSGSIASIIGLILAVFFFLAAKTNRELTFYVHPVRTTIVKMGQASRLAVSFDGRDIKNDITAVQVALWNRGKKVIKKDAVLAPIFIYTVDRSPILEARIMNTTREIVGVILDTADLDKGKVGVSWRILENGDGCSIQFIYEGTQETQFKIHGVIEGQKRISEYEKPIRIRTAQEQYESRPSWRYYIFVSMGMVIFGFYLLITIIIEAVRKGVRSLLKLNSIVKVLFTFFVIYGGIDFFLSVLESGLGPPFGF